jgi:EAL domain-containing protein (putative c-di-GMP-specific phosphodiesterase class I)
VRAVLGLSSALHLPVIAEGVETESERAFLMREGCHQIQGYLIGRPQPIAGYSNLISGVAVRNRGLVRAG